jgi:ABC-type Na+ transport system ATPase subunit NatA
MPPSLTTFAALGLHNERDVSFDLKDGVRILVDENGSGKTTMLILLYSLLRPDYRALSRLAFRELRLDFDDGQRVSISQTSFTETIQTFMTALRENPVGRFIHDRFVEKRNDIAIWDLMRLSERAERRSTHPRLLINESPILRRISMESPFSVYEIATALEDIRKKSNEHNTGSELQRLRELLPNPVLWFPTYRRIEEDLRTLGYSFERSQPQDVLIQFGMEDVTTRLSKITTAIQQSSVEWYSIVIGQMISQLTDEISVTPEMRTAVEKKDALGIILARVGNSIQEEKKQDILRIVGRGSINEKKYDSLVYFLYNLMKIYEQQRAQDEEIKAFVTVINKYLRGKQIQYDESKLTIAVMSNDREMLLRNLSSGEKQIVSIFTRVYLGRFPTPPIILFDEPELSLSLEWQRMFLEDIQASKKCAILVAATHSPFIYDNKLDAYASQLKIVRHQGCAPLSDQDEETDA